MEGRAPSAEITIFNFFSTLIQFSVHHSQKQHKSIAIFSFSVIRRVSRDRAKLRQHDSQDACGTAIFFIIILKKKNTIAINTMRTKIVKIVGHGSVEKVMVGRCAHEAMHSMNKRIRTMQTNHAK